MMYEFLIKNLRDDTALQNCDFDFVRVWMHEAADVIEGFSKKGEWLYTFYDDEVECRCSVCDEYSESFAKWIYDDGYRNTFNFCPNCGARMMNDG